MSEQRCGTVRNREVTIMKNIYSAPNASLVVLCTEDVISSSNYGMVFDFAAGRKDPILDPASELEIV